MRDEKRLNRDIKASKTIIANLNKNIKLEYACLADHQIDLIEAEKELAELEKPSSFEMQSYCPHENVKFSIMPRKDGDRVVISFNDASRPCRSVKIDDLILNLRRMQTGEES